MIGFDARVEHADQDVSVAVGEFVRLIGLDLAHVPLLGIERLGGVVAPAGARGETLDCAVRHDPCGRRDRLQCPGRARSDNPRPGARLVIEGVIGRTGDDDTDLRPFLDDLAAGGGDGRDGLVGPGTPLDHDEGGGRAQRSGGGSGRGEGQAGACGRFHTGRGDGKGGAWTSHECPSSPRSRAPCHPRT